MPRPRNVRYSLSVSTPSAMGVTSRSLQKPSTARTIDCFGRLASMSLDQVAVELDRLLDWNSANNRIERSHDQAHVS